MSKNKIKPGVYLYPMPVTIVGANIKDKPNFMTIAWVGIVEYDPPMISISASQSHYTNQGIIENETFSVNIPSEEMLVVADYIGIKSGKEIDKSGIFEVFYGSLSTAPMIKKTPINLECKLFKRLDTERGHDIFIGEIVNAYCEEQFLTNGLPDISKFHPVVFTMNDNNYWSIGKHLGRAWSVGKKLIY